MSDAALVEDTGGDGAAPAAPARDRAPDGKFVGKAPETDGAAPVAKNGTAAPAANGKTGGTLAGGAEVVVPAAPATWPDDWRDLMAKEVGGEDKKAVAQELKRLQRFASPMAVWGSQRELETKLTGLVRVPGPKASEDDVAAYRKALGVPETVDGYFEKLNLGKGKVLGEADKPVAESFATALHAENATPGQVSKAIGWWLDYQQAAEDQRQENDGTFQKQTEIDLRKEWGAQYKPTSAAIKTLYDDLPPQVRDIIDGGRSATGNLLGNDPDFMRWLGSLALDLYPAAQNYGADGTTPVSDRLTQIRKIAQDTPDLMTNALRDEQTRLIQQQQNTGKRARRAA